MKQFANLTDAIFYQTSCPICHENLKFENMYDCSFEGEKVVLYISTSIGDTICINIKKGTVQSLSVTRDNNILDIGASYRHSAFASTDYSIYDQTLNSPITISCNECGQFSYRIQVQLDFRDLKIISVGLESETISVEDGSTVYEIKNSYDTQITKYSIVYSDGEDKAISIPLITLNLENPNETIARVQKLLIFS